MKQKQHFSLNQNPLKWHRKERYDQAVSPDVERWKFDQVYDYALWLEEKLKITQEDKERLK